MDFSFCDSYTRNAFSSSVDDDDDDDDEEARIPPLLSLSLSPLFSATRCGLFSLAIVQVAEQAKQRSQSLCESEWVVQGGGGGRYIYISV